MLIVFFHLGTYRVYGRILNLISGRIPYTYEYQVKPLHIAKYIVMVNRGKSFCRITRLSTAECGNQRLHYCKAAKCGSRSIYKHQCSPNR